MKLNKIIYTLVLTMFVMTNSIFSSDDFQRIDPPSSIDKNMINNSNWTIKSQFFSKDYIKIDDYYVIKNNSEFNIEYEINNIFNEENINILIEESLLDSSGKTIYSKSSEYNNISPGSTKKVKGEDLNISLNKGDIYVLNYSFMYRLSNTKKWTNYGEGQYTIKIFNPNFEVEYSIYDEIIYEDIPVQYMAKIKNLSNIPLNNIVVKDTVLGEISIIDNMKPMDQETLSAMFILSENTESELFLFYDNPFDSSVKNTFESKDTQVKAEVLPIETNISLTSAYELEKAFVSDIEEVKINFKLTNNSDKTFVDVWGLDWTGEEFLNIDKINPNETYTIEYIAVIDPQHSYDFNFYAPIIDTESLVKSNCTVMFSDLSPSVEITSKIDGETIPINEETEIFYTIKNTGDCTLNNVRIFEPQLNLIKEIPSIKEGEEISFSLKSIFNSPFYSKTTITAEVIDNNNTYSFTYENQEKIFQSNIKNAPNILVSVDIDDEQKIRYTLVNDGNEEFLNGIVLVNDKQIDILSNFVTGNIITKEVDESSLIKSNEIIILVTAYDEEGNEYVFKSDTLKIKSNNINLYIYIGLVLLVALGTFIYIRKK